MGILAGLRFPKEGTRRNNLMALEDKRVAFAHRMRDIGYRPERTLYVQREGGFWAMAADGEERFLLYGPGPGEDADFSMEIYPRGALKIELRPESIAPAGMGGAFGMGTRGAEGFTYLIERPDGTKIAWTLLSGTGAFLEADRRTNALLSEKRSRGGTNFVWAFSPGSAREIQKIGREWLKRMSE